ncbi:MAG TPA: AI-2E family transporter [Methylocella sp.]|nr:AI-2E family transporter [Methylocella sp.]
MTSERPGPFNYRQFNATFVEMAVHLGFVGFLAYWTFLLVSPFLPFIVWSVVLTVALYPAFDWLSRLLGGRRGFAAALITIVGLFVVIGPMTWLAFGMIDGMRTLIGELDSGKLIPPPSEGVKTWPLIGPQLYDFWALASTNIRTALGRLLPQLQPLGEILLDAVSSAGTGMLKFLVSVIIAGFLFSPGPKLVAAARKAACRIDAAHGEKFVALAGATIRAVSRGVIGIAILQAVIGGVAFKFAGVPAASLLTLAILVLGIIQIGPVLLVAPLVLWAWSALPTQAALILTACLATLSVVDNLLKPFVLTQGLASPRLVTFIGVIGGVLAYGFAGLFIGPVILSVAWDLGNAWIYDSEPAASESV